MRLLIAVLVVAAAFLIGTWAWPSGAEPPFGGEIAIGPGGEAAPLESTHDRGVVPPPESSRRALPTPIAPTTMVFPASRSTGGVFGRVVDATGEPVVGAEVTMRPHMGPLPPGMLLEDDRQQTYAVKSVSEAAFAFIELQQVHGK